ncbi:MAG: uracil-DNA glycosylase family protein, partial [Dehalococcoidia bacterium]
DEIEACRKWLDRQIEVIKPKVIVTLGRHSMARFFPGATISRIHGTSRHGDGVTYFAMYHPAAALHQGSLRRVMMEDMLKLPSLLAGGGSSGEQPVPQKEQKEKKAEKIEKVAKGEKSEQAEPKQLSMF